MNRGGSQSIHKSLGRASGPTIMSKHTDQPTRTTNPNEISVRLLTYDDAQLSRSVPARTDLWLLWGRRRCGRAPRDPQDLQPSPTIPSAFMVILLNVFLPRLRVRSTNVGGKDRQAAAMDRISLPETCPALPVLDIVHRKDHQTPCR